MAVEAPEERWNRELGRTRSRSQQARNERWGTVLAVMGALLFVAAWFMLTVDLYSGGTACGTAVSNPGWSEGASCHGTVVAVAVWGWLLQLVAIGLLVVAANLRWGEGWLKGRYEDATSG